MKAWCAAQYAAREKIARLVFHQPGFVLRASRRRRELCRNTAQHGSLPDIPGARRFGAVTAFDLQSMQAIHAIPQIRRSD
jgi:hypothetical protein